jgi:hypothetical protein
MMELTGSNEEVDVAPLNDEQIIVALAGMPYPARLWEIVAWAQFNGAWPAVIDPLFALPDREYVSADDIRQAVHAAQATEPSVRPCHHRRHPRYCSARRDTPEPLAG